MSKLLVVALKLPLASTENLDTAPEVNPLMKKSVVVESSALLVCIVRYVPLVKADVEVTNCGPEVNNPVLGFTVSPTPAADDIAAPATLPAAGVNTK
jgi:hypothetical protein